MQGGPEDQGRGQNQRVKQVTSHHPGQSKCTTSTAGSANRYSPLLAFHTQMHLVFVPFLPSIKMRAYFLPAEAIAKRKADEATTEYLREKAKKLFSFQGRPAALYEWTHWGGQSLEQCNWDNDTFAYCH